MNKVELNETGYAFVWMGRVVWHRRLKAIRWALRNLWNALCGYELSLQWDPEKMGDTRNRPTTNPSLQGMGHLVDRPLQGVVQIPNHKEE